MMNELKVSICQNSQGALFGEVGIMKVIDITSCQLLIKRLFEMALIVNPNSDDLSKAMALDILAIKAAIDFKGEMK